MFEQLYTSIPHALREISIKSDDHKFLEYFYYQLSPYVFWGNNLDLECVYEVIEVIKGQNGYTIKYAEKNYAVDTERSIISHISQKILWSILLDNPYVAFHCAVLSNTSNNFLFAAPSGTGKSTLSAFLHENGFTYYTDDKVTVNCLDGAIIPFAKPIHLREGGKIVLEREYNISIPKKIIEFGGEKRYLLDWQSTALPERKKLRVIFVERSQTRNVSLIKLSKQDAFIRLADNLIFADPLSQKIKLILQLIANTECFLLNYYNMNDALHLINGL